MRPVNEPFSTEPVNTTGVDCVVQAEGVGFPPVALMSDPSGQ